MGWRSTGTRAGIGTRYIAIIAVVLLGLEAALLTVPGKRPLSEPPEDALITHYAFNRGLGPNITPTAGTGPIYPEDDSISFITGINDTGARFLGGHGSPTRFSGPPVIDRKVPGMTVSLWTEPITPPQGNRTGRLSGLFKQGGGDELYISGGYQGRPVRVRLYPFPGTNVSITSDHPLVGRWTHIAVTYGNDRLRLYIAGRMVAERRVEEPGSTERPVTIRTPWFFGEDDGIRLDEVRIYERALSPREIQAIYRHDQPDWYR